MNVNIGQVAVGRHHPPILIAGPCVIESLDLVLETGRHVKTLAEKHGFPYIFKSSFEKANRTAGDSYRGPGLEAGLQILRKVREDLKVPVLTDIHLPGQADATARVVDCLQIPAFLCRQTELIEAAAEAGKPVNIKKGQFIAPTMMKHAVDGYGDLIVDMRSLVLLTALEVPVIFDATHSVQKPAGGAETAGEKRFIQPLAQAAAATGAIDGLFIEVHPEPEKALSDAKSQLALDQLEPLLAGMRRIFDAVDRKGLR
jgi:2-dehydro-3-deoxyphosphooctonate aldolase (KDO 8-P synthase)